MIVNIIIAVKCAAYSVTFSSLNECNRKLRTNNFSFHVEHMEPFVHSLQKVKPLNGSDENFPFSS